MDVAVVTFENPQPWPALVTELIHTQKRVTVELYVVLQSFIDLRCNLSTNPNDFKFFSSKYLQQQKLMKSCHEMQRTRLFQIFEFQQSKETTLK